MALRELTDLGPYFVGETPEPLVTTLTDSEGGAIDISGCTISARFTTNGVNRVDLSGTIIDGTNGVLRIDWLAFVDAGLVEGQVFYTSSGGVLRVADDFRARIVTPAGT